MSRKTKALEFAQESYNIVITGRNHLELTDALKDYAMEKISKIERYTDRMIDVNVTMDTQRFQHRADIVLKCGNLKVKASATTNDMYVSIDQAVEKIKEQLLKYKNRIQDHHARDVSSTEMNVNVIRQPQEEDLLFVNDEIEGENQRELEKKYRPHKVVKKESRPLKTLTMDEAVMKMELSGDPFLVFLSEDDRKVKVIYRRKDEEYGIMEPQS